jgi:hypothetical protein
MTSIGGFIDTQSTTIYNKLASVAMKRKTKSKNSQVVAPPVLARREMLRV